MSLAVKISLNLFPSEANLQASNSGQPGIARLIFQTSSIKYSEFLVLNIFQYVSPGTRCCLGSCQLMFVVKKSNVILFRHRVMHRTAMTYDV